MAPCRLFLWPLLALAAPAAADTEACLDRSAERHAYYGDLHIHTGLSADAMLFGTTNRPDDAYRFAKGETIAIRSIHGRGPEVPATIARPLDFAGVTDHAENIGAVSLCVTPGSPAYDTDACKFVRAPLTWRSSRHISRKSSRPCTPMSRSAEEIANVAARP